MATKTKKVVNSTPIYPTMSMPFKAIGFKQMLQRRAKFAPQLIADGFRDGVSADQGNLIKGVYDDPQSFEVDGFSYIGSDKFDLMSQADISASVDPVESSID